MGTRGVEILLARIINEDILACGDEIGGVLRWRILKFMMLSCQGKLRQQRESRESGKRHFRGRRGYYLPYMGIIIGNTGGY